MAESGASDQEITTSGVVWQTHEKAVADAVWEATITGYRHTVGRVARGWEVNGTETPVDPAVLEQAKKFYIPMQQ